MLRPFISLASLLLFLDIIISSFALEHRVIDYAGTGQGAQTLDIYLPSGTGPFPVVIFYDGLAFTWSDAKNDGGQSRSFNEAGCAIVGANLSGGQ